MSLRRQRGLAFDEINKTEASGVLTDVLRDAHVYIGGCSIGPGLKKAAHYYFGQKLVEQQEQSSDLHCNQFPGVADLCDEVGVEELKKILEEPFYVVDIGVVVSQMYQWRRFFPRVEPFYAVKCNPDPVIIKTLAVLGCNFDCASRNEIRLVQEITKDLSRRPDIVFANPCKPRAHMIEAVARGAKLVTFDNATEVMKCASISKKFQLILRIITDDRGSQCRLSSKYGAPRSKWRPLLAAAKQYGLPVVGVSFHVGSGCRDASRYELALQDAREIFDIAEQEFGMKMYLLDIGGGFPGETHSIWNPAVEIDEDDSEQLEGKPLSGKEEGKGEDDRFMFFTEIAKEVAPVIDMLFPSESGVRIISEPGRYFVAAAVTLCCSVIATRSNEMDTSFAPEPVNDKRAAKQVDSMTREDERALVRTASELLMDQGDKDDVIVTIKEELKDYSKLFTAKQLTQQEVDVYNDSLDWCKEGFETAIDMLGPPDARQKHFRSHTVEGISYPIVAATAAEEHDQTGGVLSLSLAAAGEAAVKGMVLQAVADSAPLQDDFAYYISDGIYGAFNNLMYDHASVRPRVLRTTGELSTMTENGFIKLETFDPKTAETKNDNGNHQLYQSTVFGPTCDAIDIIARSVLLPKLKVGDWMYFENMGAYTMAAASSFNGFTPGEKFYVCSVQPEYFEAAIAGPEIRKKEKKNGNNIEQR